jgi:hypothetical protein
MTASRSDKEDHHMADTTFPAWLIAKIDQRLALLDETKLPQSLQSDVWNQAAVTAIVMALEEPDEDATPEQRAAWERQCDNCGTDCSTTDFYTGHIQKVKGTVTVLITFGVCPTCKF